MVKRKAYFLDADYIVRNDGTYIRLLLKGKGTTRLYYRYDPYFYVSAPLERIKELEKVLARAKNGDIVTPLRIEPVEKQLAGNSKTLLKVFCRKPKHVPVLKEAMSAFPCYEHRILFSKRVMMDLGLTPLSVIRYEREGRQIKRIISIRDAPVPKLETLAFDIETYNPAGKPRDDKDPILMISWSGKERGVMTYKKSANKSAKLLKDEHATINAFCDNVREENPDVLFGYNSSLFDLPYMETRSKVLGTDLNLGRTKKGTMRKVKKGLANGIAIPGRMHIDLYPLARFFGFIGLIKSQDFTLGRVGEAVFGKGKIALAKGEMWKIWDSGEIDDLVEYSLRDAVLTKELGDYYLPLLIELSKTARASLFDTSMSTSGQLVESLLMFEAVKSNAIIPSKPLDSVVKEREAAPIQGAFVKLPEPGLYENIAVLDFRGMYPSIIVSYNIDPFTLSKNDDRTGESANNANVHLSPTAARFLKKPQGLIPRVVEMLLEQRGKIKNELKKSKKETEEWRYLTARSNALKILTNSFYGYLGYARSRWYSRECAESTTAWGRQHIQETIESAEKNGFKVLYGDTDSIFIIYKNKDDVLAFLEKINKTLPGRMELELEGFYTRGVFVSKKAELRGAKKKYALLGDDGRIKIRGFELVRRDWSEIAKNTQYQVLEVILKEGNIEKAAKIVRDVIIRVKGGAVPMEELAIETQLNKETADYAVKSPELAAAAKGIKRGMPFDKGSIVSYVITKTGKTISEKADLAEFAKDYDADYYINNQILPAVMKILNGLGYDEEGLKTGGKQKGLDAFF